MIYQNPKLLYALFAIAIPILIHLFNLRRHQIIYFSSIRFLKDIKPLISKKAEFRENILDSLHHHNIEIVSPNFINQRVFSDKAQFIPETRPIDLNIEITAQKT